MITENLQKIQSRLPEGVGLVAVSKFNPVEAIREAYNAGQRLFGESRVQELLTKIDALPADIRWHFIGHLQANKARKVVGRVALIESIDSEKLLALVSNEAMRQGVVQDVLLQIHVAAEETKFGFTPTEFAAFIATRPWENYPGVRIRGVMGMASNVDDQERILADFRDIRKAFDNIFQTYAADLPAFDTVSMGMSGDWEYAAASGSTLVRLGSAIFGPRMYQHQPSIQP